MGMNPPVNVQSHVVMEPRAHLVVVGPGHNLIDALERYAKEQNLQNGIICSCVGDIDLVTLVVQRAHGNFPSRSQLPLVHPRPLRQRFIHTHCVPRSCLLAGLARTFAGTLMNTRASRIPTHSVQIKRIHRGDSAPL